MNYKVNINGIDVDATFSKEDIENIYKPLLQRLSLLRDKKGARVLVMLAAPPGAGKSTLVSFLEELSKEVIPDHKVQSIGMDGFHRRQEYLLSHTTMVDGKEVKMQVKVGQKVIYSKYAGTEVKLDGQEMIIVRQSDILAIVE